MPDFKPKLPPGTVVGNFIIVEWVRYSDINPDGKVLKRKDQYYMAECACGNVVELSMDSLRRKNNCGRCRKEPDDVVLAKRSSELKNELGVPNFATMRLK